MSEVAQQKVFYRENYTKDVQYGAGTWWSPTSYRKEWDDQAYRLAVEGFLTSLGPGRVISVNVQDGSFHEAMRIIVWYWDWDKAGSETIQI
jgi:hypothetical protein